RHTRWPRDWSSDVCSSDLAGSDFMPDLHAVKRLILAGRIPILVNSVVYQSGWLPKTPLIIAGHVLSEWLVEKWKYPLWHFTAQRSEERRVGKECRSQG